MIFWLGIIGAPLVFLTDLSLAYALVPWACRTQHHSWIDLVSGVSLVLTIVALGAGWLGWQRAKPRRASPVGAREEFMGQLAVALSALSMLAAIAQWATRLPV